MAKLNREKLKKIFALRRKKFGRIASGIIFKTLKLILHMCADIRLPSWYGCGGEYSIHGHLSFQSVFGIRRLFQSGDLISTRNLMRLAIQMTLVES
jgi:hypothetical protein